MQKSFDAEIASKDLRQAAEILIEKSPNAETFVIANAGDFLHMSNPLGTTARGTPVDVDTRMPRVLRVDAMTLRFVIDRAPGKYDKVIMVNVQGNHDSGIGGWV